MKKHNTFVFGSTKHVIGTFGVAALICAAFFGSSIASAADDLKDTLISAVTSGRANPITDSIKDLPVGERATRKGLASAQIGSIPKIQQGKYFIEVKSTEAIPGGVQVYARAWDLDGRQLGFGVDGSVDIERFRIFNPAILVPNGTTHLETLRLSGDRVQVSNFREDIKGALLQTLEHAIAVAPRHDAGIVIPGKIGRTTDVIYSQAGGGGGNTTTDGVPYRAIAGNTWSELVSGAGTGADVTTDPDTGIYMNYQTLTRAVFTFDTSPIGSDSISSSTLSVYGTYKSNGGGCAVIPDVNVYQVTLGSANNVVASDFNITNWGTTELSTTISYASYNDAGYNNFSLNSSGLGNINPSGVSQFGLRNVNYDVANSAPPGPNGCTGYLSQYYADHTGTTVDPMLVIVHALVPMASDLLAAPQLSAIFAMAATSALATYYNLQISTSTNFDSTLVWDSGKQTLSSSTPAGQRIPYVYSTSTWSGGQTYYWRLKFWDQFNTDGPWSTSTPSFVITN